MGQNLAGNKIKNTYQWLLQVGATAIGVLTKVSLGNGTESALSISDDAAKVDGDFTVTGNVINGQIVKISEIANDLVTNDSTKPVSAAQAVVLKGFIDQINVVLTSNDVSLDELQELVDYIKNNRGDIDSLGIAGVAGLQTALDAEATARVAGDAGNFINLAPNSRLEAAPSGDYINGKISLIPVSSGGYPAVGLVLVDRRSNDQAHHFRYLYGYDGSIRFQRNTYGGWQSWQTIIINGSSPTFQDVDVDGSITTGDKNLTSLNVEEVLNNKQNKTLYGQAQSDEVTLAGSGTYDIVLDARWLQSLGSSSNRMLRIDVEATWVGSDTDGKFAAWTLFLRIKNNTAGNSRSAEISKVTHVTGDHSLTTFTVDDVSDSNPRKLTINNGSTGATRFKYRIQ